jgi:ribonuclease P protein component
MPRMTRSNALHSGWPAALLPKPGLPPALTSVSTHAFPKAARLTKTDEFSSVFALRPRRRSTHFVLYVRANGQEQSRLGIVVGKKFAPRAAERNLVKRMVRELFRSRQAQFAGRDILLRLQAKFARADFASRTAIRRACLAELSGLLDVAARPLPAAPPVAAPAPEQPSTPAAPAQPSP